MSTDEIRAPFSATHHALLFAWISREVLQHTPQEQGEMVIRKGIRRYGEQRGRRMALRAQANGHALTMANYMAYGEWRAAEGEMGRKLNDESPHVRAFVRKCSWHTAWRDHDLMAYGRLYCLEIDEALVRGFNPELRLDVNSTQTNGDPCCEFVYHDANPGRAKPATPGDTALMPWDYHAGHLYKTVGEVVIEELGRVGREALDAALAEFARCYGEEAGSVVSAYWDTDFNRLPE